MKEKKLHTNQNLPVHRALKFSAVLGTTSARNSITTRPAGLPLMVISKYTLGLDLCISRLDLEKNEWWRDAWEMRIKKDTTITGSPSFTPAGIIITNTVCNIYSYWFGKNITQRFGHSYWSARPINCRRGWKVDKVKLSNCYPPPTPSYALN